jgi:hypothetical protein
LFDVNKKLKNSKRPKDAAACFACWDYLGGHKKSGRPK